MARRKGKTWYIGTIGAAQAREVEIPLSSIVPTGRYTAEIWADAARNAKNTVKTTQTVTAATRLRARLAPAGGHVVVLRPR